MVEIKTAVELNKKFLRELLLRTKEGKGLWDFIGGDSVSFDSAAYPS